MSTTSYYREGFATYVRTSNFFGLWACAATTVKVEALWVAKFVRSVR